MRESFAGTQRKGGVGSDPRVEGEPRRVEDRLRELAGGGGFLRRAFAALAGRLVATRAYERLGYARLGDYARERLGVSARTLQDLARVDSQLGELPRLEAALGSGGLAWSRVRLVARVATPDDERGWIARARTRSVRQLEREVRAVERGALGQGEAGAGGADGVEGDARVRLQVPPSVVFKWHRACRDAQRVAGESVTRATVLEWMTAEVLAGLPAEVVGAGEAQHAAGAGPLELMPQRADARTDPAREESVVVAPRSLAPPPFVRALVDGLDEIDAFELDARLRRAVRLEQRRDAELASLLRAVTSAEFEWSGAWRSLEGCACELLGISPRKARALLRIERVGDRCPALREAFRDGALSWAQAQQVARLALGGEGDEGHLALWVRWARTVSFRKLEDTVQAALALGDPTSHPDAVAAAEAQAFAADAVEGTVADEAGVAERQTCARPRVSEPWPLTLNGPREVIALFSATLCSVRLAVERESGRLLSAGEGFEMMLDHALQSWAVEDPWLRRRSRRSLAIFERDGWRCTVPGCTSRRNLQLHHIRFRSAGGSDEAGNLTTLCAFHHLRGVHDGRVGIAGSAPDGLRFELGVRAGRQPLVRYDSDDRIAGHAGSRR